MSTENEEYNIIDRALSAALDGDAILFLGAGVGSFSSDSEGRNLPSGRQLSEELSNELSLSTSSYELSRVAQFYRKRLGAYSLTNYLKSRLTADKVDVDYADLLRLRWKRIYTTNYDNAVELCRSSGITYTTSQEPRNVGPGDVIHLNGYVGNLDLQSLDNDVILTDWNYANSAFHGSKWESFFRNDIVSTSYILFLGLT